MNEDKALESTRKLLGLFTEILGLQTKIIDELRHRMEYDASQLQLKLDADNQNEKSAESSSEGISQSN